MQQILARCLQEFENDEASILFYKATARTFENNPKNTDKVAVLLKFTVLNNLYWTNIWARDLMVNYIHKLGTEEDLDTLLEMGNPIAVNKIRQGHKIRSNRAVNDRNFYSFATKYCHLSNPKCYPIYDQYVHKAIMNLRKSNNIQFRNQDELKVPQTFQNIIDQIIQRSGLADYQQVDRALWVYGQYLDGRWSIIG